MGRPVKKVVLSTPVSATAVADPFAGRENALAFIDSIGFRPRKRLYLPDVSTVSELGYSDAHELSPFGVFPPTSCKPAIRILLNNQVVAEFPLAAEGCEYGDKRTHIFAGEKSQEKEMHLVFVAVDESFDSYEYDRVELYDPETGSTIAFAEFEKPQSKDPIEKLILSITYYIQYLA